MLRTGIARLLVPIMLLTMLVAAPMSAGAVTIKITNIAQSGTPAVGNTVTWTPTVTGGSGNYEYIYTLYKTTTSGSGYDYLPKTTADYSITFTEVGTYYLQVVAYDTKYDVVSAAKVTSAIVVPGTGPRLSFIDPNTTSVQIGSTVQWTVYGETGSIGASGTEGDVTYEYSLYRKSDDLVINTIRTNPVFAYTLNVPGYYNLRVRATDDNGTSAWIETGYLVSAYAPAVTLDSLTVSSALISLGESVTVKATASGGYKDLHYYWTVYKADVVIDSFDTDESSIVYTPDTAGIYHFGCEVCDQSSQTTGIVTTVDVTVTEPAEFDITSITRSSTTSETGKVISWKISLTGGIGTKTVVYTVYRNGTAYSTSSVTTTGSSVTASCYVSDTGKYTIKAYAFDSKNNYTVTNPFELTDPIIVYDGESLYLSDLMPSIKKLTKGTTVTWTFQFHNNVGGVMTTYTIYRSGTAVKTGKTTGKIIQYKIADGDFGLYTIELSSVDVITGKTCTLTGGTVDYTYSGALSITNLVPVKETLDTPGTAEWLFDVEGDPMGEVTTVYTVNKGGSTVASGTTTAFSFSAYLSEAGTYTVTLTSTDATGRTATLTGGAVTVSASSSTNMTITNLKAVSYEVTVNAPITWTYGVKSASGSWKVAYKIMFTPTGSTTTVELTSGTVTEATSISYTPTATGKYSIKVQGIDSLGSTEWYEDGPVVVKAEPNTALSVTAPSPDKTSCKVGETITWTFTVNNPVGSYMVFYAVYQADKIMKMSSASDNSPISYVPNNPGFYSLKVYAMDSTGTKCDPEESSETEVTQDTLTLDDLIISVPEVSTTSITSPTKVTWTFTVSSQLDDYVVNYKVYKVNGATTTLMIDNVTSKSSFSVYLDETGNYYATVQAQATDGSSIVSQIEQSEYVVCNLPDELIEVVTPDLEPAFNPEISLPIEVPVVPETDQD